ncbi:hypothetical protein PUW24_26410 [Paenibacillus urinalis]|uniref:DUF4190 domain-containing protein n=1 Tax=Paenibacillus urinalis TaxID=521520 RepID=A0AAX3MWA5_9BACL|nr:MULTISPECIES: hypothetical protein [Paenibacillus]WDH81557.1 hypothetical protein PUW23_18815 [Paenibacillus urinalis]WDH97602.1 hypothetical protein PUW24_26410 [Paenibacillus urinalis]WDI01272.1 hypothetical protein PUW25_18650 [Paenibacillus urinalis]GAK39660.1 hypothetical protein TCA2_2149 [Paenibacillus sp. TCA20]
MDKPNQENKGKGNRDRIDFPRKEHHDHQEEYAAEISPSVRVDSTGETSRARERDEDTTSKRIGYLALAVSIVSLFLWSYVVGVIGIVLGYYAFSKGRRTAGGWAMGIGIAALVSYAFLVMFTYY